MQLVVQREEQGHAQILPVVATGEDGLEFRGPSSPRCRTLFSRAHHLSCSIPYCARQEQTSGRKHSKRRGWGDSRTTSTFSSRTVTSRTFYGDPRTDSSMSESSESSKKSSSESSRSSASENVAGVSPAVEMFAEFEDDGKSLTGFLAAAAWPHSTFSDTVEQLILPVMPTASSAGPTSFANAAPRMSSGQVPPTPPAAGCHSGATLGGGPDVYTSSCDEEGHVAAPAPRTDSSAFWPIPA